MMRVVLLLNPLRQLYKPYCELWIKVNPLYSISSSTSSFYIVESSGDFQF